MTSDLQLKEALQRAVREKLRILPSAPKTVGPGSIDDDEYLEEPILPDGRQIPSLNSRSGTVTTIQAMCPNCKRGNAVHAFVGMDGVYAKVICTACLTLHKVRYYIDRDEGLNGR